MKTALLAVFLLSSVPAFAKAHKGHCVGADGSEMTTATSKKACKKAGGKWQKMSKKSGAMGDSSSTTGSTPK